MISFIIPTLNEEKVISKLIGNLKKITDFEYEIIISDGGSSDKTVEIAKSHVDLVVEHKENFRQTIAQGRNAGAKAAKGDFLVFLDADVFVPNPNVFFAKARNHFFGNTKVVAVNGWLRVFPEMETFGDKIGYGILTNWSLYLNNNIFHFGAGCGEFGMFRKKDFVGIGGYREDLAVDEDQDLTRRLSKTGRILNDPELLVYHTGRRPHTIGWPKLLWEWVINWLALVIFNRSADKEWKVIR